METDTLDNFNEISPKPCLFVKNLSQSLLELLVNITIKFKTV